MIKERVLKFSYPYECINETETLISVFHQEGVEFICYISSGYYPHEFTVRKSGKTWNEIYKIVNSCRSAKYKLETVELGYDGKKLFEYAK